MGFINDYGEIMVAYITDCITDVWELLNSCNDNTFVIFYGVLQLLRGARMFYYFWALVESFDVY